MQNNLMIRQQITDGFKISVNQLIPNTKVNVPTSLSDETTDYKNDIFKTETGFYLIDEFTVLIWFSDFIDRKIFFKVERAVVGISECEENLLRTIPLLLHNFQDTHLNDFYGFALKLSCRISFDDLIIAKFLESDNTRSIHTPLSILLALQELTFTRYEEKRCTSGFVYTSNPEEYIIKLKDTNYIFHAFEEKPILNYAFFETPATYRYVDGRNSFYLIDEQKQIHGTIRLTNPNNYSLIDRIGNLHINELLQDVPGNSWISFVGLKDEVYVIVSENEQIKWSKNHWHFRDRSLIVSLLAKFSFNENLMQLFISILFSLSELRYGSVILIPDDNKKLPPTIGIIDNSQLGSSLRNSIRSANILNLTETNSILGILSSDGLTTISKNGTILSCGDIIDISQAADINTQGGGRSQAAISSSFYGVSIKISQDGPISIYYKGEKLIQF
jgi:DNA integrity scanning protein DisA with diadenylate cyclase activity